MNSNLHELTTDIRAFIRAADSSEVRFNQLALRLASYQFQHNPAWRRLCEARDWTPRNADDWRQIPAAPAAAFKELELTTLPPEQRAAVFHSSGTAGQTPSRHFHGAESLSVYEASLLAWFEPHLKLRDGCASRLLFLTPSPALAPRSSLVHMFDTIRRAYPECDGRFFGGVDSGGTWTIRRDELERTLADSRPAALFGAAFQFVQWLEAPAAASFRTGLPDGSRVLETGGYKGRSRSLTQAELHALIAGRLGVRRDHIVCEYGMSELSSQAYDTAIGQARNTQHTPGASDDCHRSGAAIPAVRQQSGAAVPAVGAGVSPANIYAGETPAEAGETPAPLNYAGETPAPLRRFRFPPWARVQIISPETGREVAEGGTGLIRVFDLANAASVLAVQTEDLAIRRGDGFEFIGRAAAADPRGCSLMTA